MSNKKRFVMKLKNKYTKLACIVKLDKLLYKLDKNLNFTKSKKTTDIPQDKSKMREPILLVKDVITLDPNTMKSNVTAS